MHERWCQVVRLRKLRLVRDALLRLRCSYSRDLSYRSWIRGHSRVGLRGICLQARHGSPTLHQRSLGQEAHHPQLRKVLVYVFIRFLTTPRIQAGTKGPRIPFDKVVASISRPKAVGDCWFKKRMETLKKCMVIEEKRRPFQERINLKH